MSTRARLVAAATAAVLAVACLFAAYGVAPGRSELADPLGLPVRLMRSVTASTDAFDRDIARIVDQYGELRRLTGGVGAVAAGVSELRDRAGRLLAPVEALDRGTGATARAAADLPARVGALTGRAEQGAAGAKELGATVGSLQAALDRLVASLRALGTRLEALGPPVESLASTLEAMRQDTAALGALLRLLGLSR